LECITIVRLRVTWESSVTRLSVVYVGFLEFPYFAGIVQEPVLPVILQNCPPCILDGSYIGAS